MHEGAGEREGGTMEKGERQAPREGDRIGFRAARIRRGAANLTYCVRVKLTYVNVPPRSSHRIRFVLIQSAL